MIVLWVVLHTEVNKPRPRKRLVGAVRNNHARGTSLPHESDVSPLHEHDTDDGHDDDDDGRLCSLFAG